jgi:hypothetical protein
VNPFGVEPRQPDPTPACAGRAEDFETRRPILDEHGNQVGMRLATIAELTAARDTCRACPALAWCRDQKPIPEMVLAGVFYNERAKGYRSATEFRQAVRQAAQVKEPAACAEKRGTYAGYRRHCRAHEKLCDDCRQAYNAHRREHWSPRPEKRCKSGHRWPANPERDKRGNRLCVVCAAEKERPLATVTRIPLGVVCRGEVSA